MADPLGSLEKIVKLALRIKEAVDTVRHNREECQEIRTRAVRVSSLLSLLPQTGITGHPAMGDALGDLEDALRHAHALVTACQQSSTVCLYCTAGKQAGRLRRVQDDISQKMMLVVFATNIHTTIFLSSLTIGYAGDHAPPPAAPAMDAEYYIQHAGSLRPSAPPLPAPVPPPRPSAPPLPASASVSVTGSAPCRRRRMEGLRKFSLSELEAATDHFSVENMVGSGGFATVYKGVLHDGLIVAVKKFQHPHVLAARNIDKLHLISNLEHENIIKLIGYSCDVLSRAKQFEEVGDNEDNKTYCIYVEEYMPNGSLDKTINGLQLDWSSSFCIIQGIAHGLSYLQKQEVVHMDVKPSNILLDCDMNPKIADFGIARVLNDADFDICFDNGTIAGTLGYMPPEYITNGTMSKKHDVYGFGVTILEIISGMSRSGRASGQASIKWAWEARQAGGMMEKLDPSRFDAPQLKEIERCVEVGLLCTQFEAVHRPDMLDALEMLRGEKALRTPVRPGYTSKEPPPVSWLRRWLRS